MKPIVDGLEAQYGNEIEFVYYNIDDPASKEAKEQFGYRVQPHFFLVDTNGEIVTQWVGPVEEAVLEEAFAGVLNN